MRDPKGPTSTEFQIYSSLMEIWEILLQIHVIKGEQMFLIFLSVTW